MGQVIAVTAFLGWSLRQQPEQPSRRQERRAVAAARRELAARLDAGELTQEAHDLRVAFLEQETPLV